MPHKRNPIKSEQLTGLARVLRGYLSAGLEDVALWHERDISHSSVERIVLPDASILTHYMLVRARALIEGLVVDADRMRANFDLPTASSSASPCCWPWWPSGLARDDAYRIVQRDAMRAWEERRAFRTILEEDPEVTLKPDALDEAFDLERALRHATGSSTPWRTSHEDPHATVTPARSATCTTPATGCCCSSRPTGSAPSTW